ncbi:hypothetical protein GCM10007047_21860 [Cerasicoccus arenae]|uniref:Uncharacterized protein n=1 Tax=Cerasicoccus arenae TaxID=424488 RepID=A0A8J3GF98_9BACT|nr:hypothetical protein GCM10007047_21860 [Cerasicoccus arenae]
MAHSNHPWSNVIYDDRSCSNHGPISYGDVWAHKNTSANPSILANRDRWHQEGHCFVCVVVSAATEVSALGNSGSLTDLDEAVIIHEHAFTQCSEISDLKIPGIGNDGCRMNTYVAANTRAVAA